MEDILEKVDKGVTQVTGHEKPEEGKVARMIEKQTAKLPSDVYLWASISSMAVSLSFKLLKKNSLSLFVGQWAAPFLLFGIYNKMVKQEKQNKNG
ncbi:hypothetical protein RCC89_13015 [Cytophagaceae bacterium ABcell3]|nr:hypothetical protein RCC89_13015 [Cytophagaceae bacterium ABcell3]